MAFTPTQTASSIAASNAAIAKYKASAYGQSQIAKSAASSGGSTGGGGGGGVSSGGGGGGGGQKAPDDPSYKFNTATGKANPNYGNYGASTAPVTSSYKIQWGDTLGGLAQKNNTTREFRTN